MGAFHRLGGGAHQHAALPLDRLIGFLLIGRIIIPGI
jgi:hypothetical protein